MAPGTQLGPYQITAPIGAGGMGEVFRARDTRLARDVAVKVLPSRLATDEEALARLESQGFTTLSVEPGFSNHQHSDPALGRVDVIYVSGPTADAVFAGCTRRAITAALDAPVPVRSTSWP